jgi:hypothetical protein
MGRLKRMGMVSILLFSGCGGEAIGPDDDPFSDLASISITPSHALTLSPGQEAALAVTGRKLNGKPFQGELQISWSVEQGRQATIGSDGILRAPSELGLSWVFATVGNLRDSVALWVQKPESEPSTFQITLFMDEEVPPVWRLALQEAAERWKQVIRDTLPTVDITTLKDFCGTLPGSHVPESRFGLENGVRIEVLISGGFPPDTYVEAVGGPCMHRGLPQPTTALGRISLNRDKFHEAIDADRKRYVAHHEMGHTLGLAGVIQGLQPSWVDAGRELYRGHLGLYGHYLDTGEMVSELSFDYGSHWPVTSLMGMNASLELRHVSVGSLMDFGYPAAWYGAGWLGLEDG